MKRAAISNAGHYIHVCYNTYNTMPMFNEFSDVSWNTRQWNAYKVRLLGIVGYGYQWKIVPYTYVIYFIKNEHCFIQRNDSIIVWIKKIYSNDKCSLSCYLSLPLLLMSSSWVKKFAFQSHLLSKGDIAHMWSATLNIMMYYDQCEWGDDRCDT